MSTLCPVTAMWCPHCEEETCSMARCAIPATVKRAEDRFVEVCPICSCEWTDGKSGGWHAGYRAGQSAALVRFRIVLALCIAGTLVILAADALL